MKKHIYILVSLIITVSSTEAQEHFASYQNEFHGFENQILMTLKQQNFTLWITGLPVGEEAQIGGIAIKEDQYLQFYQGLNYARQELIDWRKNCVANNVQNNQRSLRLFIYGDAFFKDQTWHYDHNLLLRFDLIASQENDSTSYFLNISSGALKSAYSSRLQSPGFSIVFSNEDEISQFLEKISTKNINHYITKLSPVSEKIKQQIIAKRIRKIEKRPWLSNIEYGLQGSYYSAYNMNSIAGMSNTSLSLIEPLIPIFDGYSGGLFGRLYLKKFLFQPELIYNSGKGTSIFTFADRSRQEIVMIKNTHLKTLDIPLMFGYNFLNKNKWKFSVVAGPQLKFDLGSKFRYSYFHTYGNYNLDYAKEHKYNFQMGISAGAMLDYSRFSLGIRYNHFNNMIETIFDTKTLDKMTSSTLAVTVAWKIFEPIK